MDHVRRRKELADFLRTRRLRISPLQAGLPRDNSRRRISGLRREEVASLSGISLPWYTALEQARDIRVSEQVLESLARTLQLSQAEHDHLFILANNTQLPHTHVSTDSISPAYPLILERLGTYPAYIVDSQWNVHAWNSMTTSLCGDFTQMKGLERNVLWRVFKVEEFKSRIVNWERVARALMAYFRGRYAVHLSDSWYVELVRKLKEESNEFRVWWEEHEVAGHLDGEQVIQHPTAGLLPFRYNSFPVPGNGDFLMRVYTPLDPLVSERKLADLLLHSQ